MTWPERHELIINGIDFDAALERAKNEIFQRIEDRFFADWALDIYKQTGAMPIKPLKSIMSPTLQQFFDDLHQIKEVLYSSSRIPQI